MIIDFRLRPPYAGFKDAAMYAKPERSIAMATALGQSPSLSLEAPSLDQTLREMDAAGITMGVVPVRRGAGDLGDVNNSDAAQVVSDSNGRLIAFGAPNLDDITVAVSEVAEMAVKKEFAGVVVEPGLWATPHYPDDSYLHPIYAACARYALPLLVMGGGNAGPDITYTHPAILDHICAQFPSLTVIAAHGGWPWVFETLHVAFRRPNLYVSPDMYLFGMAGWQTYVEAASGFLSSRFLFGTAYPFVGLDNGVRCFESMFPQEYHHKLMYSNATEVLGYKDGSEVKV